MGLKDFIANLGKKNIEEKEMYSQMEREHRLRNQLEERQKSANERELEKFMEKARQEKIKKALDGYRKRQTSNWWKGNNLMKQKNLFKNQRNIFAGNGCMLKNG